MPTYKTDEQSSRFYRGRFVDEHGIAIPKDEITSLVVTLYSVHTGEPINNRIQQSLFDENGGTVQEDTEVTPQGTKLVTLLTWHINPQDNVILDDSLEEEHHRALITWTWGVDRQNHRELDILVRNLEQVF